MMQRHDRDAGIVSVAMQNDHGRVIQTDASLSVFHSPYLSHFAALFLSSPVIVPLPAGARLSQGVLVGTRVDG